MSSNEFMDSEDLQAQEALRRAHDKADAERDKEARSKRSFVNLMNGDFLSRDQFIKNMPFVFFIGFLLVILIGWGYYAETITKKEVRLETELAELNSEFFTLGSEYNTKRGRRYIAQQLEGTGVVESVNSPRKIRVKKYIFEIGK